MEKKPLPNWLTRSANSASLAARGFIERQIPFFPVRWIEKIQQHRLRSIIRHAYETVPFYRQRSLPVLERLEGRSSDVIRLHQNRNMSVLVLEGICRYELKSAIQVQIVQTAPDQIIWRIVPFSDVDITKLKSELIFKTRSVLGDDMNVAVEIVEHIPRTSQGKFQKLISEPVSQS